MEQLVRAYLHKQLKQYAADTTELWAEAPCMHTVLRVTHQSAKMHLLALMALLSTSIHHSTAVILLSSQAAQELLLQGIEQVNNDISQAAAAAAPLSAEHSIISDDLCICNVVRMHVEPLTVDCAMFLVVASWEPLNGVPVLNPAPNASPSSHPRHVLMIADHSLCVDDEHLSSFWTYRHEQRQLSETSEHPDLQRASAAEQKQLDTEALKRLPHLRKSSPAMDVLYNVCGQPGPLWRLISTTYSLPGLCSGLVAATETCFTAHHIQTALPAGCIAHPMMLSAFSDMQAIQRRVVPSTAAAVVQRSDLSESKSSSSWCAVRPGLLQWLTILTEEAAAAPPIATPQAAAASVAAPEASAPEASAAAAAVMEAPTAAATATAEPSSEAKLMVVVGPPAIEHTELQLYIAASSALSVVILDLEAGSRPGMLSMPTDCVAPLLSSMQGSMLSIEDDMEYMNRVLNGLLPAKLLFKEDLGVAEKLSATCTALGAAQAKHEQPIHGIVFLSWGCLQGDLPLELGMAVTDLYLCDLADCLTPHGKTPVTEMPAKALAMVTTFLCGVHDR